MVKLVGGGRTPEALSREFEPTATTLHPGASVDAATQAYGFATPLGIDSPTGVAGLTLGGGFGWLSQTYGMTVDNLLSTHVVTADGRQVRAGGTESGDLSWGCEAAGATSAQCSTTN